MQQRSMIKRDGENLNKGTVCKHLSEPSPYQQDRFVRHVDSAVFAFLFPGSAMVNSLLATAYISIFPNLLLYFVPPDIDTSSLNTLVSFAVGKYSLTLFLSVHV
jgi:hypothetical protein